MTPDIVCKNCGLANDYRIEQKANNKCAYCNGCDTYIKNIPYTDRQVLYFGKYKGQEIQNIQDKSYLEWTLGNVRLSSGQKEAISMQIEFIKNNCN